MKEYIGALGAAVILSALIDMLVPDGGFKKYCRLVCGFVVAAVMLSPITGGFSELSLETAGGIDAEAAEAEARARILMEHKGNLEKLLEGELGGKAYVEVDGEGNVTRVTLDGAEDEAAAREYIGNALGIEGSNVRINENKAASEG